MRGLHGISSFAMLAGALLACQAADAQQPSCSAAARFLAVSSWTGTVTITGKGNGSYTGQYGTAYTYSVSQSIQLAPSLTPSPIYGPGFFQGPENVTVSIDDVYTSTPVDEPTDTTKITASGTSTNGAVTGGAVPGALLSIESIPAVCGYAFGANEWFSPFTYTLSAGGSSQGLGEWGTVNIPNLLEPPATDTTPQGFVPFPATGLNLSGSVSFDAIPFDLPSGIDDSNNQVVVDWTITWSLNPAPRPLDLILTIPGYATWRPSGGADEKTFGFTPGSQPNALGIEAQLVYKDTQKPTPFAPDNFIFKLVNVSHEPGVSLNWPPKKQLYNPTPPDLTFKDLSGMLGPVNQKFTFNSDGTQATFVPKNGENEIGITLLPWDWGGWATLNVTATIGSQTVQGHFSGNSNTNILLPKRQSDSKIADIWKTEHDVPLSTPDDDDSETSAVGRSDCDGDGFTLYEEYRGFMAKGNHIEGDPHNKDFFIENVAGADFEPGIFLFTALTGLVVHEVNANEVKIDKPNGGFGSILINFNHAQGAHANDQHGVTIAEQQGVPGGPTVMGIPLTTLFGGETIDIAKGFHDNPSNVYGIAMQIRSLPSTGGASHVDLSPGETHGGVITPLDSLFQYDVAVAHELSHSIGVLHHGPKALDSVQSFSLMTDFSNPSLPAYFTHDGQKVQILTESGQDVAAATHPSEGIRECQAVLSGKAGNVDPQLVKDCQNYQKNGENDSLWVGGAHGIHSGDDNCIMRYFFAQIYPSQANANVYYLVPEGTEPLGMSLCERPTGTGINAPGRLPQPRYFDADSGYGACQTQPCVNDKYPLVSAPPE